jgi:hypothetical protein
MRTRSESLAISDLKFASVAQRIRFESLKVKT